MDPHSYSNPGEVRVRHISLDVDVRFEARVLEGSATLSFDAPQDDTLVLDTRGLVIHAAEGASADGAWHPANFELGAEDGILGAPLWVHLAAGDRRVRIAYTTSPGATALQWLAPAQTAGKQHPFLYTQSQAIHARSWMPAQDTPAVRVTYDARIRTPLPLVAVMSAEMRHGAGEHHFHMPQPVPTYLIALAVGDLAFAPLGARSGVYAERLMLARAAHEFADTEAMIAAVERLYGPYRWGRYDLLVLPPSFPFGGMENPRLTFVTPTMIAGDRSLVSLVAHELAHSWSGNLVTNATWEDFWLNEGFTVYLERRILEEVYGADRARMEACLGRRELERELGRLPPPDTVLHLDLKGRDPDDGCTLVPYEKGFLLLKRLEAIHGRTRFDAFLRSYFEAFVFQSVTTNEFVSYLSKHLASDGICWEEWLTAPGLPADAPGAPSEGLSQVEEQAAARLDGRLPLAEIPASSWTVHEWLHFLRSMPQPLPPGRMQELDGAFFLTRAGNAEVLHQWLLMAVRSGYQPALAALEPFLISVGRRKFVRPLYEELVRTPEGRDLAAAIYARAREGYHPIAQATVDAILKVPATGC